MRAHWCLVNVLVTGCAGFIGSRVCLRLLELGHTVTGVDNLNAAYDVRIKQWRLDNLRQSGGLTFIKVDTQGSDLRVLQGAIETIKRCLPTIVFEFERIMTKYHGAELSDYEDFFETIGYKLTVLKNQFDGK